MSLQTELQLSMAELQRRLFNMVQFGTIHSVDYDNARVRVIVGHLVTTWLPWQARRAGAAIEWWPPEIGEQVMILAPSGELAQAGVIPSFYSDAHPPPSTDQAIRRTNYADGSFVEYNETTHKMTVTVNGGDVVLNTTGNLDAAIGGNAEIIAQGEASVTANNINLDGAGGSALLGVVQGNCMCTLTGAPHPQISATVKASP